MKLTLPFDPKTCARPCHHIKTYLLSLSEPAFGDFQAKLMPTVARETVLGVRTPALRLLAKTLYGTPAATAFMDALPHATFEENNLHAFLISESKTFDEAISALDIFLPYVDNWATCDQMSPKVLSRDLPRLKTHINTWLSSDQVYTVRYGMGMLMRYYLGEQFTPDYADDVASALWRDTPKDYYIDMMGAWYFATALAFNYKDILPYLTERRLPLWVHNKTIQKALESYRITDGQKAHLKGLRRKR